MFRLRQWLPAAGFEAFVRSQFPFPKPPAAKPPAVPYPSRPQGA
jgi:hypothetical protein